MSDDPKIQVRKCYCCDQPSLGICPVCEIPLCFECGKEHPALESQYTACTGAPIPIPMTGGDPLAISKELDHWRKKIYESMGLTEEQIYGYKPKKDIFRKTLTGNLLLDADPPMVPASRYFPYIARDMMDKYPNSTIVDLTGKMTVQSCGWDAARYFKENKTMRFTCLLIQENVATANGRIYTAEALAKLVEETKKQIQPDRCYVTLGYPSGSSTPLDDIIGLVKHCNLIDGRVELEIDHLATPKGQTLTDEQFGQLQVGPYTMGTVVDNYVDPASLQLICWVLSN